MFQLIALPDLSSPVATGSDGVKLQGRAPERASKWISRRYGHIVDGNNANLSYRRTSTCPYRKAPDLVRGPVIVSSRVPIKDTSWDFSHWLLKL
jgi:hypothetical protein